MLDLELASKVAVIRFTVAVDSTIIVGTIHPAAGSVIITLHHTDVVASKRVPLAVGTAVPVVHGKLHLSRHRQ